ncbi:hypothetical protein B551_0222545 [Cupriavidus sp. HPC(L)]|uniref:Lar family restriction alleviation protein n=1 Tax=Cupriavidus sp. HPC(L) TaxID=1217418 RepID=UPI000290FFF4|nr:Lar family restriction alleviation protein [Cupriavidus sp. HPC(L)]ESH90753.1 hypothetical protein B551_0222545 [Cupriavidus sp. HPC(L)]
MAELQPCPFCGCAMRVHSNREWHYAVGQHDDGCLLVDSDFRFPANDAGRADLLETWNRRATDGQRAGVPSAADDIERQYKDGIHIGSGLPRATCPCGFCAKHRIPAAPTPPASDAGQQIGTCPQCGEPTSEVGTIIGQMEMCSRCSWCQPAASKGEKVDDQ